VRPRRPSDYNDPLQIVEQVFAGQMLFLNDDKAHQMQRTLCRNCMVDISRSVKEYSLVEQLDRDAPVGQYSYSAQSRFVAVFTYIRPSYRRSASG